MYICICLTLSSASLIKLIENSCRFLLKNILNKTKKISIKKVKRLIIINKK